MSKKKPWVERIFATLDHIQSHLDEDLAPEELAAMAELSLHHFHRVFRGITGETVMGFVRRLRVERGAQRLKFSGESVTQVALSSGYGSHEAFTRAFRARFGQSPSVFRREQRRERGKPLEVTVRSESERVCLAYRWVGSYEKCEAAWPELTRLTGLDPGTHVSLGLVYDDPDVTSEDKLRYDACYEVATNESPLEVPMGCVKRVVPAGNYAVALHRGGYDDILETYVDLLGGWLPERGVELANEPIVEIYLNDYCKVAPEELRTELCVRIE